MKLEFLDELYDAPTKKDIKNIGVDRSEPQSIKNQDTIDAIEEIEAMIRGEIPTGKVYSSAEEMWSDICGT